MQQVFSADQLMEQSTDFSLPVFIDTTSWEDFEKWAEENQRKLKVARDNGLKFYIFESEFKNTQPEHHQRYARELEAENLSEDVGVTLERELRDKLGVIFHPENLPSENDLAYKTFLYETQLVYFHALPNREKSQRHSEFVYLLRRAGKNMDTVKILTAQPALTNVRNAEIYYLGSFDDSALQTETTSASYPIFGDPSKDHTYKCDIFMVMPFADKFTPVYEQLVKPIVEELGLSIKRGDDPMTDENIMHEVWSMIHACKVVIADCTDLNANVFYEIGIAHSVGRQVVTLIQDASQLPFDIRHRRAIVYSTSFDQVDEFKRRLKETLRTILNIND